MVWFYRKTISQAAAELNVLSIPLWSDFIANRADYYNEGIGFQSHYGLILSQNSNSRKTSSSQSFQSHYGLILSKLYMHWDYPTYNFQSHYGLILSVFICNLKRCWRWPFNPTMVWFYRYYIPRPLHEEIPFNPTMVWFYPSARLNQAGLWEKLSIPLWSDFIEFGFRCGKHKTFSFQSHYGLILSNQKNIWKCILIQPFNPTMVWFYPTYIWTEDSTLSQLSIPLWSDFIKARYKVF